MSRRPASSIVASPVLVGAVTALIAIVAVFLAYNANQGLPFVPTYDISAELPGGSNLVDGNDVQVGGGNEDPGLIDARYGGGSGRVDYRVYAKYALRGSQKFADGSSADDRRRRGQLGFRLDRSGNTGSLMVKGDAFFSTTDYEGLTGSLTCDEFGDCADAKISVSEVQDGAFVRIWPEN